MFDLTMREKQIDSQMICFVDATPHIEIYFPFSHHDSRSTVDQRNLVDRSTLLRAAAFNYSIM